MTAGLSALPFAGLEIWAGSSLIMAVTLWRSLRRLAVKACVPGRGCAGLPQVSAAHVSVALLFAAAGLAVTLAVFLQHEPPTG